MPTVDGKKFSYDAAGMRAAAAARRAKVQGNNPQLAPRPEQPSPQGGEGEVIINPYPPQAQGSPETKARLMNRGYNFTRNIGGEDLPDVGY